MITAEIRRLAKQLYAAENAKGHDPIRPWISEQFWDACLTQKAKELWCSRAVSARSNDLNDLGNSQSG